MSKVVTDYTVPDTLQAANTYQYRVLLYFRDIIQNWMQDARNIQDKRLTLDLYDAEGRLKPGVLRFGTLYNVQGKFQGTTPSFTLGLGDVEYNTQDVNICGNAQSSWDPTAPLESYDAFKSFALQINVVAQQYLATVRLAEQLQRFLLLNATSIVGDARIAACRVRRVTAPRAIQAASAGNTKQVYQSSIILELGGVVSWTRDTEGPVFRGLTKILNFNN